MTNGTHDPSHDPAEIAERLRDAAAWLRHAAARLDAGDYLEARQTGRVVGFGLEGRQEQIRRLEREHPDCVCPPDDTIALCRYHAEGGGAQ